MRLTPKQVAERAGVSRSLVYALLRDGRLPAVRIGCRGRGKWLVEQDAVEAFIEACKVEVRTAVPPLKHLR